MKYSCVVDLELAAQLRSLSGPRYASVIYAAGVVAGSPHLVPEFSCRDDDGRLVRTRFFGKLVLSFVLDDAVREVRIVAIEWA